MNCPNCGLNILEHPANRCLDALVAIKVMGWQRMSWEKAYNQIGRIESTPYWHSQDGQYVVYVEYDDDYECPQDGWHPTVDISAAWEVVEKMKSEGWEFYFEWDDKPWALFLKEGIDWCCSEADTPSLAISRASLLTKMEE
jgi:hypothetical protein